MTERNNEKVLYQDTPPPYLPIRIFFWVITGFFVLVIVGELFRDPANIVNLIGVLLFIEILIYLYHKTWTFKIVLTKEKLTIRPFIKIGTTEILVQDIHSLEKSSYSFSEFFLIGYGLNVFLSPLIFKKRSYVASLSKMIRIKDKTEVTTIFSVSNQDDFIEAFKKTGNQRAIKATK